MANETEIALREQLNVVLAGKNIIRITNQETYDDAARFLLYQVQPFRKRWADYWKPLKQAAHEAHAAVVAKFNEGDEPAKRAEEAIKAEIRKWDDAQERLRQELQAKAQREAVAREAAERAAQAAFAEEEGAMEEAQAVVNAPSVAVAEPVPDTYQRVSGISKRDNWQAEVRNLKALCAAIAKGTVPVNYVLPNQQVLNARAKADRETMNVPGVVPVNNAIISGRSR
jgi:hypothetical protein